jgi:nucleotide sugar dehydrogenase
MILKPEDLNTNEKRGKYTACVVGCGHDGILHAVLLADAGFKVVCYDSDQNVLNNLSKGHSSSSSADTENRLKKHAKTGQITALNDMKKAVASSDIIAITIPAKVDSKNKVDYTTIESMCKKIGSGLRIGSLIIVMKPVGIGLTQTVIKDAIENSSGFKLGKDFSLTYSPWVLSSNNKRIVATADKNSLNLSASILEPLTKTGLITTQNVKAAEMAVLFGAQRNDVDHALANELAMLCEKTRQDYLEVAELLKGTPSSVLTEENGREEPYLLLSDAENQEVRLRVAIAARETNEQMGKHLANLVKDALKGCGKTIRRARISLLGVTQEPNIRSHPKGIVKDLIQLLTTRGARISIYDPYLAESELTEILPNFKKTLTDAIEGADCIVILTGHDQFKRLGLTRLKMAMKKPAAIVDFEGIIDPDKVEKEGLIYRGLGRGVWTK